jgi:hypothetical protein
MELKFGSQVFVPASFDYDQEVSMRSKIAISATIVAYVLGATAIATAQTSPPSPAAPNAPAVESGAEAKANAAKMAKTHPGTVNTTTGMSRTTPGARVNHYKPPS